MTIDAIHAYPEDPDVAHIADPGHDARDAEPSEGSAGFDAITHIPSHGASRTELFESHAAFAGMRHGRRQRTPHPDLDAVLTGVPGHEVRDIHDEAVQVRQLLPTHWDVYAASLVSNIPVSILPARPERMGMCIINNGPATVYLGPISAKGTLTTGFPLVAGASLRLDAADRVYGCIDTGTGASADVRISETYRTDNRGS